jgi:hypothetical protein
MKKLFCAIMVAGLLGLGLSGVAGAGPGFKPAQSDPSLGGNGGSALAHSVAAAQGLRGGIEGGVYIHRAQTAAGKFQRMTGAPEVQKGMSVNRHAPSDKPFLMPVEDVFSISGRGTVATGRIDRHIVDPKHCPSIDAPGHADYVKNMIMVHRGVEGASKTEGLKAAYTVTEPADIIATVVPIERSNILSVGQLPIPYRARVSGTLLLAQQQPNPLDTLRRFELQVSQATDFALEALLQDLNRRKDFDFASSGGPPGVLTPGPHSAWLWERIQVIQQELIRRGYAFSGGTMTRPNGRSVPVR